MFHPSSLRKFFSALTGNILQIWSELFPYEFLVNSGAYVVYQETRLRLLLNGIPRRTSQKLLLEGMANYQISILWPEFYNGDPRQR